MTRHPYPGLRAFTRDESDLFFGREGCVDEMVDRLGQERFLAVLGPSGGGKSSLVRTGLFDALDLGFLQSAGTDWLIIDMHPAGQPMCQLATALLSSVSSTRPSSDTIDAMAKKLRQGPRSVAKWAADGNVQPGTNILLLVDQFEELFRYANYSQREEADAFVALLLESAATKLHPIYVVITMRSEYLGACSSIEQLAEHISKGLYLTPRMERAACREAIEGPAGVMGFLLEPALVNRMLNDLATFTPRPEENANDLGTQLALQADQLPLMQHVLNRLWLLAESAPHEGLAVLTLDAYKSLGGMSGAIDAHGKEIVARLTPGAQQALEPIFRALVAGNSVATATRQPTKIRELVALAGGNREDVIEVIEAFRSRDCNFLRTSTTALNDDTIVDISHESLIRQWTPLREWLEKEARDGAAWRRLVSAEERYTARTDDLLTGLGYQSAAAWWAAVKPNPVWASRHGGNFEAVKQFFEESQRAEEFHLRAERLRQKRERRLLIAGIAALAAIVLVVSGLGILSWRKTLEARRAIADDATDLSALRASRNQLETTNGQLRDTTKIAQVAADQLRSRDVVLNKTISDLKDARRKDAETQVALKSALHTAETEKSVAETANVNAAADAGRLTGALDNISNIIYSDKYTSLIAGRELRADLMEEIQTKEADIEKQHVNMLGDASRIRDDYHSSLAYQAIGDVPRELAALQKGYEDGLKAVKITPATKELPSEDLLADFLNDSQEYIWLLFDVDETEKGTAALHRIQGIESSLAQYYSTNHTGPRTARLSIALARLENLENRYYSDQKAWDLRKQHAKKAFDLAINAQSLSGANLETSTSVALYYHIEWSLTEGAESDDYLAKGCALTNDLYAKSPYDTRVISRQVDCLVDQAYEVRRSDGIDAAKKKYEEAEDIVRSALRYDPGSQSLLLSMANLENDISDISGPDGAQHRIDAKDYFVRALKGRTVNQSSTNLLQSLYKSSSSIIFGKPETELQFYKDIVDSVSQTTIAFPKAKGPAYIAGDAAMHVGRLLAAHPDQSAEAINYLSESLVWYDKSISMQDLSTDSDNFANYCGVYVLRAKLYGAAQKPDLMLADATKMKSVCSPALEKYPWDFHLRDQFIASAANTGSALFTLHRYKEALPYLEYASHWADKDSSLLLAKISRQGLLGSPDENHAKELEDLASMQSTATFTLPLEAGGFTYHENFTVHEWPADYPFKGIDDQVTWWKEARGITVDPQIAESFRKLFDIARTNHVSFPALCEDAINKKDDTKADPKVQQETVAYKRALDLAGKKKWKQADQAIDEMLSVDPESLSLLSTASNLYHEQWFQFDRAFSINQRRVELGSQSAESDLAEAALSATHYETCTSLAATINDQTSEQRLKLIMTSIEFACLTGEKRHDEATATGQRMRTLVAAGFDKVDWNFSGTKYFVSHHPPFSTQEAAWVSLFEALNEGDKKKALDALTALGVPAGE